MLCTVTLVRVYGHEWNIRGDIDYSNRRKMEKKKYFRPAMLMAEVEPQSILQASTPKVRGEIEGDQKGLEYGGDTKPGGNL